jgi:hypothetical protein
MGLLITLTAFVGLAAIIVWIADWTSGGERRQRRDRQGRIRGEAQADRSVKEVEKDWGRR